MNWRHYAGRHALAEFVALEHEGARMLVRAGYEDSARLLVERKSLPATEMLAGGRESHPVVVLPTGERAVIRRYRRGGLMARINHTRYFGGNRAYDELRATERARAGGVRTARIIAAVENPRTVGYTAMLATLLIVGAEDAAAWLQAAEGERRAAMLREAGHQLALMHAAGVAHPDVNLRNLLVVERETAPEVYILDFDKAVVHGGPVPVARRVADLRRLARSARKLRVVLGEEGWSALEAGYGAEWPPRLLLT
ncbi:MAG TPA: lipopolysaccharide kinase InaA family protein [Longimicrobium sp.]|jgi:3-deoxy-D-manno-octulosonic acid kinase|uniref:lipopolysaccharide kinase InaA family protein n=1 Tax=Longimicrobium sp. TaxID=2029185 RepID=UPI002EDAC1C9